MANYLRWMATIAALAALSSPLNAQNRVDTRPLDTQATQRRAIRGCPVNHSCRHQLKRDLAEFELNTFATRAGSPWITSQNSGATPRSHRPGPTELRPDLPWLAKLRSPDFPVTWDHRTIRYLEFYKSTRRGRSLMRAWLRDRGKYRDMIESYLGNANLPRDLLYVAMIESSYNPREHSRAGASGLWQFMPAGGRIYGLTINRWIDERRDPERSTKAAMLYLADLKQRFGNWDLALTAYNAGYGAVLRAISKYNTNDLWVLLSHENALPWGSSIYVPKATAAAIVGNNLEVFGFDDVAPAKRITWDYVKVPRSLSVAAIARAARCSPSEIRRLNPQLLRDRTPPQRNYAVRVPRGHAERFRRESARLRKQPAQYTSYRISHGERFEDVATTHGISRARLRKLNGISRESDVRGGEQLLVPRLSAAQKRKNRRRAKALLYASGVPKTEPGGKLIVPMSQPKRRLPGKRRVLYRVVTGDTLHRIARALRVSPTQLAQWNNLEASALLHPRMVLVAYVDKRTNLRRRGVRVLDNKRVIIVKRGSQKHLNLAEARMGRKRVVYRARRPESLRKVGSYYGLTARDLARINRLPPSTVLKTGERIIVYKVVDGRKSKRSRNQQRRKDRTKRQRKRTHSTPTTALPRTAQKR